MIDMKSGPFLWKAAATSDAEAQAAPSAVWGGITATLDWCEENYIVSTFVAEWWNTVSNLVIILLSWFGYQMAVKYELEPRFRASYLTLFVVGVGSAAFHCTLKYWAQMLDELPMIWTNSVFMYTIVEDSLRKRRRAVVFGCAALYSAIVSVVYVANKSVAFHETAYGAGVGFLVYKCYGHIRKFPNKTVLPWLLTRGLAFYGSAFVVWNIDNIFCARIRAARAALGWPLKEFLQLHAWWHAGTGIGTYMYIVFSSFVREFELGYDPVLGWRPIVPGIAVPYLIRRGPA